MSATILESLKETSWRETAMRNALDIQARSGEATEALLSEIRAGSPGGSTLLVWPDRLQLMRFLKQLPGGLCSLLFGEDTHIERKQLAPYLGWYSVEWDGASIEVVLTPSSYINSCVICAGPNAECLHRFSKKLDEYGLYPAGRCLKYSKSWRSAPEMDAEIGKVTWDNVVATRETINGVRDAVEGFYNCKDAYDALGFPWRRGLLLIGPPGTGKTMLCKAPAAAVPDMPFLYVRDFASDPDNSREDAITTIFRRARRLAPCLLAFEDIDGLLNDANRSAFLNEMDGFQNNSGLLIIASSNHPERIDEALLKRPSRFDRVFHIGLPALPERREYCVRMLTRFGLAGKLAPGFAIIELADKVAQATHGFTPTYLQELFISAGLERAQAGAVTLDEAFAKAVMDQIAVQKKALKKLKTSDSQPETPGEEISLIGIRRNR